MSWNRYGPENLLSDIVRAILVGNWEIRVFRDEEPVEVGDRGFRDASVLQDSEGIELCDAHVDV